MARKELLGWVGYWDRGSNGPNLHNVHTFADLVACRTYNPCMQGGVVANVSDAEMWNALQQYRGA